MRSGTGPAFVLTLLVATHAVATEKLPARERMQSCDPLIAVSAAREILNSPASLREPVEMFSPAFVLFQNGQKDDALFWFYAAQIRARYQLVFEPGDRAQLMQIMMGSLAPPINNYGLSDTQNMVRVIDRVLEWDQKTANPLRNTPQTSNQRERVAQVYTGVHEFRDKLNQEGPAIETEAKRNAWRQQMGSAERAKRCAPGQLDPSLVEQQTRKEQAQVIELVRNDPGVLTATGGLEHVSVAETSLRDSNMPSHYTVHAQGQRSVYAEIDVTRSGQDTQFVLRCTTLLDPGKRQPGKDPCAQTSVFDQKINVPN